MNTKKSISDRIEASKGIFFKTGLIIAMVMVLAAFQYRAFERTLIDLGPGPIAQVDDEMIDITIPKPPDPPAPPAPQEFTVTPDEKLTEDEFIPVGVDDIGNEGVQIVYADLTKPEPEVDENKLFDWVEVMPEFPGGLGAMYQYLSRELVYPRQARETGIQGMVIVGFVVEKDGSISNVRLMRGIGGGCDEEAMRVVAAMPRWTPGQMGLERVRVSYSIPVRFKLD